MKLIIEARLVDDISESPPVRLATIDRESTADSLGLSLAEAKAILASAQRYFVDAQCQGIAHAHSFCEKCDAVVWRKPESKRCEGLKTSSLRRKAPAGKGRGEE